jgi:predicted CopG family antitoxin
MDTTEMPKTITITDEAYNRLTASMNPGESISDAILRLIPAKTKQNDIMSPRRHMAGR